MKTDFSASTGGKTATSTGSSSPFDQIATLETQEAERAKKELDAMEKEQNEVEIALQEKDEKADAEMRDTAREELKEYRESELNTIVNTAEVDGQKAASKLDSDYESKEKALVDELVTTALSYK